MVVTTKDQSDVRSGRVTGNAQGAISSDETEQLTESIFCRHAYKSTHEFQAAIAGNERTLQSARAMSEEHVIWESLINLGIAWASHKLAKAGDYFPEAATLARNFQDPTTFAYSLNPMGNWMTEAECPLEGIGLHQKALTLSDHVKNQHGMAIALYGLGNAFAALGRVKHAVLYYRQASAFFRAVNDRVGLILTLSMRSVCGTKYWGNVTKGVSQDLANRVRDGEEALLSAQEIGWRCGEALAFINMGMALIFSGQYGRALKDLHSGLQIAIEIEHQDWQTLANIVLGAIYLDLFSLEQAQEHLEQPLTLAFRLGSSHWHQIALGFLVHAYILQRKLSRAEEVLSSFSAHTPMHTIGQRQAWSAMAELSLARGNVDLALEVTDRLFNLMPTSLEAINFTLPRLANLHCTILSKLNRETEIPAILDLGLKSAIDQGALPLVWRFHVQLGQMKRQQRKYRQSDRHYVEARRLVDRLANTISDPSLRENFLGRAGGMIPEPSPTRAARHAFGGLTKREFEVSTLIALRQSNQDIADQLGVAKHYIDKYFESILAKLGLNSRAQIAEWVMYRQVADNFKRRQHKKGNENEPSFTKSDTKTE